MPTNNNNSDSICFTTHADKDRTWPLKVVPKIKKQFTDAIGTPPKLAQTVKTFAVWLDAADLRPYTSPRARYGDDECLHRLHELVRSGKYRFSFDACDYFQPPEQTISEGGDCDQWATVVFIAAYLLGFPRVLLVAVGNWRAMQDRYAHVYPMVQCSCGAWHALDAQDGEGGKDFDGRVDPQEWPDQKAWLIYQHDDRPKGRI